MQTSLSVNDEFIQQQIAATFDLIENAALHDLDWPDVAKLIRLRRNRTLKGLSAYGIILPILTCLAVGGQPETAVPVASAWVLFDLAGSILDDMQDQNNDDTLWSQWLPAKSGVISAALICATQVCLNELKVGTAAKSDIVSALSEAQMQAARHQVLFPAKGTSFEAYFEHITAKAGVLIAAVTYAGARVHTSDADRLDAIYQFGLSLGILMQLNDDLRDISSTAVANDLVAGYYSLPILYALSQTKHPQYAQLVSLLYAKVLTAEAVSEIIATLGEMGAFTFAVAMAQVYQDKAHQYLKTFPVEQTTYLNEFLFSFLDFD